MSKNIWIQNLKFDINQVDIFRLAIKDYIKHIANIENKKVKVHASIISQFENSLEAITILMNSNYEDPSTLLTKRISNINGIFIYLRKMIEADMILNIVINNGKELYEGYLFQNSLDKNHVNQKFGNSNKVFKASDDISNKKYHWIEKALGISVNAIDDLVDLALLTLDAKSNMKAWIKECNYMSHPTLYSDDKIFANFNEEFINDIYYAFRIISEMTLVFYSMIETIEKFPEFKSGYDMNILKDKIPNFLIFRKDFFIKKHHIIASNVDFHQVDYNQIPYNIRAEISMMTIGITAPFIVNELGDRKRKTLNKLIDIFAEDIRDLLIGYYQRKNDIFYPKIRQVLEDLSYVNQILNMTEEEIEIFQIYIDIQRYDNMDYVINVRKDFYGSPFDFKKWHIRNDEKNPTIEQYYQKNLKFYKEYFKEKYQKNIKTEKIKRPNSWLYNGKTIPSNWNMIETMLLDINESTHESIDFYKGLYSLSSLYCHINYFSLNNDYLQKELTYIKFLKALMVLVKTLYDKLISYAPNDFKANFIANKNTLNRLIYDLYNYDIIDVPNPN